MKTYAVPYMYYLEDEPSDPTPLVTIVKADTPEDAIEIVKKELKQSDINALEKIGEWDGDEDNLPSIWTSDEKGDEEGWVIGTQLEEIDVYDL